MASTPSGSFALIDRLMGGKLAERLEGWRTADPRVSYDDIARTLQAEDYDVSRETVGRWCRKLGLDFTPQPQDAA